MSIKEKVGPEVWERGMHLSYTIAFAVWFAWFLASDVLLMLGWTGPWWYWLSIWGVFLAIEIPAALREKKEIDTFSEHVWAFIQGKKDRMPLGVALAFAMGCRVISVPAIIMGTIYDVPWSPFLYSTWASLGVGITAWLAGHLPKMGRDG